MPAPTTIISKGIAALAIIYDAMLQNVRLSIFTPTDSVPLVKVLSFHNVRRHCTGYSIEELGSNKDLVIVGKIDQIVNDGGWPYQRHYASLRPIRSHSCIIAY